MKALAAALFLSAFSALADYQEVRVGGYFLKDRDGMLSRLAELPGPDGFTVSPDVGYAHDSTRFEDTSIFTANVPFGYKIVHWVYDTTNFFYSAYGTKIAGSDGLTTLTWKFRGDLGLRVQIAPVITYDDNRIVTVGKSPYGEGTVGTNLGAYACQKGDVFRLAAVPAAVGGRPIATFRRWSDGSTAMERTITVTTNATYIAEFVPVSCTVSFDANGGTVNVPSKTVSYGSLYGELPTPTWEDHEFLGWAQADKTPVESKTTVDRASDHVLTATWDSKPLIYTVVFHPNGGTGGVMRTEQTFEVGVADKLRINSFYRPGHVFVGWNQNSSAEEKQYSDEQIVKDLAAAGQTVELYAVWRPEKVAYTVHFDANGGTGEMPDQSFAGGEEKHLNGCTFKRVGYVFLGWSTNKDAKEATYQDRERVQDLTTGKSLTLYAIWTDAPVYTIRYKATSEDENPYEVIVFQNMPYTLASATNLPPRTGYTCKGWKSGGNSYREGQSLTGAQLKELADEDDTITFFAVWDPIHYKVSFWWNDGTGRAVCTNDYAYGDGKALIKLSDYPEFRRIGYNFDNWSTNAVAETGEFKSSGHYNLAGTEGAVVDLYAIWQKLSNNANLRVRTTARAVLRATAVQTNKYEKAVHGNPIVIPDADEPVVIDGDGAVIDGGGKFRCATLGKNVTLMNFTLRNGTADWGGGAFGGRLIGCTIEDCKATLAGGAYGSTLENCIVTGCTATESGASLGDCTATGCTISNCKRPAAATGVAVHGGILFGSTLTDCMISGNRADFTGNQAPAYGGIGENVDLTKCTVTNNEVVCEARTCYGLRFAYSTVEGEAVEFDDSDVGDDPGPTPPDPPPGPDPEAFDGTVANNYTATLADGSILTVSTKKQTTKKGVVTVSFTAKLIIGDVTYSYSNGKMEDGKIVQLPVPKTYGAPEFSELTLKLDSMSGKIEDCQIDGNRVTAEVFEAAKWFFTPSAVSRVGVAFDAQVAVSAACGPVKFSASKLPSGLKIDKATGQIYGIPTKARDDYLPKVTATSTLNSKLKTYVELPLTVAALDEWAIGAFNGGGANCQVKITVSKTGKISGQLLSDGLKWKLSAKSFSGYSNGVYSAALDCKSGKTVCSCEICLSEKGGLTGEGDVGGAFNALRNEWKEQPWKQIAKGFSKADPLVLSPVGEGFDTNDTITLKFASSGSVSAKGKFVKSYGKTGKPSFYSANCSTVLCPVSEPDEEGHFIGTVHVYYPPKAKTPLQKGYIECVTVLWDGSAFGIGQQGDE